MNKFSKDVMGILNSQQVYPGMPLTGIPATGSFLDNITYYCKPNKLHKERALIYSFNSDFKDYYWSFEGLVSGWLDEKVGEKYGDIRNLESFQDYEIRYLIDMILGKPLCLFRGGNYIEVSHQYSNVADRRANSIQIFKLQEAYLVRSNEELIAVKDLGNIAGEIRGRLEGLSFLQQNLKQKEAS